MAYTLTKTITLVTEECINCGVTFAMPQELKTHLQNRPEKSFYCPNGHSMVYRESKEERLRKEAEKKLFEAEQALNMQRVENAQLEGKIKKQSRDLKRLTNGVCPCCNRTFSNLHNHMKKMHPEAVIKD